MDPPTTLSSNTARTGSFCYRMLGTAADAESDGAWIGAPHALRQPRKLARLAAVRKPPAGAPLH